MHHEAAAVELFAQSEARGRGRGIQQESRFCHAPRAVCHERAHEVEVARFSGVDGGKEEQDEKAGREDEDEPRQKGIRGKGR